MAITTDAELMSASNWYPAPPAILPTELLDDLADLQNISWYFRSLVAFVPSIVPALEPPRTFIIATDALHILILASTSTKSLTLAVDSHALTFASTAIHTMTRGTTAMKTMVLASSPMKTQTLAEEPIHTMVTTREEA